MRVRLKLCTHPVDTLLSQGGAITRDGSCEIGLIDLCRNTERGSLNCSSTVSGSEVDVNVTDIYSRSTRHSIRERTNTRTGWGAALSRISVEIGVADHYRNRLTGLDDWITRFKDLHSRCQVRLITNRCSNIV